MSNDAIKISLYEGSHEHGVSEVRIDGVIDTLTAGEVEDVIHSLLSRGRHKIVMDLAGVDYISSAGWGIFISHIRDLRSQQGDIKLANMVPDVYEVFELLEFDNVLQSFDSVSGAMTAFGVDPDSTESKKKGMTTTKVEVLASSSDDVSDSPSRQPAYRIATSSSVTDLIHEIVRDDPFATITEIKLRLNMELSAHSFSWLAVLRLLWREHLLSRRSRFRLAWRRA